jgi:hypothetical protein
VTVVVLSALWLWAVWQQYLAVHAITARWFFITTFRRIDLVLRVMLGSILIISGIASVVTTAAWLNWKISLFGVIILAGVGIRLVADQFPTALSEIGRFGSTTDREARLSTALLRAYPFVLGLWTLLVVMTALAVSKPG